MSGIEFRYGNVARQANLNKPFLPVQPHQLRRIILKHYLNLLRLDAVAEERADKHSHPVNGVHMQHLAKVAADDAALRTDRLNCSNRLYRIRNRLIEARDHGLAVSSDIHPQVRELL